MESISSRLQGVFNELERIGDPLRVPISVVLQECIADVRGVEENYGFADLVKEKESLEEKLEALEKRQKKEFFVLKENHEGELNRRAAEANTQIEALRKELDALLKDKAEREKKDDDIPEQQLWILRILPVQDVGGLRFDEISAALKGKIREDELKWHLDQLSQRGFTEVGCNAWDAQVWRRSEKGNVMVIAKRYAGEEGAPEENPRTLPEIQEKILGLLTDDRRFAASEIAFHLHISSDEAQSHLDTLCDRRMVECHRSGGPNWIQDRRGPVRIIYSLERDGRDYLVRHGLIKQ